MAQFIALKVCAENFKLCTQFHIYYLNFKRPATCLRVCVCVWEFLLSVGANWINFVNCCRAPVSSMCVCVSSRSTWESTPAHNSSVPTRAIWPTAASDRAVDLWRIKNIKWHYPPPLAVLFTTPHWPEAAAAAAAAALSVCCPLTCNI